MKTREKLWEKFWNVVFLLLGMIFTLLFGWVKQQLGFK